ncbi:MAG: DUF362 domain-containing protein [Parcubacteria group bacterium]|jgi:uncharacterized protein (DUF362 family)
MAEKSDPNQIKGNTAELGDEYLRKRVEAFGYMDRAKNSLSCLRIDEKEASQVSKWNELKRKTKEISLEYSGTKESRTKLSEVLEKARKLDAEVAEFCKYVSDWESRTEEEKINAKNVKISRKKIVGRKSVEGKKSKQNEKTSGREMINNVKETSPDQDPDVAVAGESAAEQKDTDPTRATARHTIRKFEDLPESSGRTYDELNAKTEEERIENFKRISRELWSEFTVHGLIRFDEKTGQIYVEKRSDLDGESFLKILELAGMSVDRSKVNFVAPGEASDSGLIGDTSGKHGVIAEEKGKRVTYDHHSKESTRDTSATKFLYKALVKLKFFDDDQKAYLDNYVKFVTKFDNLNFTPEEEGEIYANYHKNLYGLASKMSVEDVLELIKKGTNPNKSLQMDYLKSHTFINPKDGKAKTLAEFSHRLKEQKDNGEKEIPKLGKRGFVVDTGDDRFGKVLIDTMKKSGKMQWQNKISGDNVTKQLTAFQGGYGALITWSPQENKFYVSTRREMNDESIPGGFSQGINVRGHLLTNGGGNGEPVNPRFLQEILGKLAGRENFQIEGALKKAIELDEKSKELLDLFDRNNLTENDLRKTAGEMGVLLKDLLEAMFSQRDKLNRALEKRIKKLPPKPAPNRDRIAIDFLLECQKNVKETKENKIIIEAEKQEFSEKELKFMAEYEKDARYMLKFITGIDYVGRCGYKKEAVAGAIITETERYWKLFEQEMLEEGCFKDSKRVGQVIEKIRSSLGSAPKQLEKKLKDDAVFPVAETSSEAIPDGRIPEQIFDIKNKEQQIEMIKEGKVYYAELLGREKNLETAFAEFEKNNQELLEGYKDKDVLLKVNFVDPDSPQACTAPETVKKIIEMIGKYRPKKIYVGDIPSTMGKKGRNWDDLQKIYRSKLGYDFGSTAELINLEELENETIEAGGKSFQTKKLDGFGGIINISRPKMHGEFGFTGCTKNLMGFMTQDSRDSSIHMYKDKYDAKESNARLSNFSEAMLKNRPDMINITDGTDFVVGHEHLGIPKKTDFALVSRDPFNSDYEMLKLLGLNRARVSYLENETFATVDGKLKGLMKRSKLYPSELEEKIMPYLNADGKESAIAVINDPEFLNSPETKEIYVDTVMKIYKAQFDISYPENRQCLNAMGAYFSGKTFDDVFTSEVFKKNSPYNNSNFPEFEKMAIQWVNNQNI